jgi:hypothetical protein
MLPSGSMHAEQASLARRLFTPRLQGASDRGDEHDLQEEALLRCRVPGAGFVQDMLGIGCEEYVYRHGACPPDGNGPYNLARRCHIHRAAALVDLKTKVCMASSVHTRWRSLSEKGKLCFSRSEILLRPDERRAAAAHQASPHRPLQTQAGQEPHRAERNCGDRWSQFLPGQHLDGPASQQNRRHTGISR